MDVSSGDYYRRLRLPRTASPKEIKAAFRRLARQYHPDLHPNQPGAAARFQALREAYEVLSDRIRRAQYDERTARADYFAQSFSDSFLESGKSYQRNHDPKSATDFYIRGIRQALAHCYAAALKDYSEAITLDPNFAEAYLRRAEIHALLEDDSAVLADCQRAIELDPTESKIYLYQGLARYRLGYVQSSISAFSDAITRDPEDARAYNWRAIAAQDLGDIDDAAPDFRRAAQLYRQQGDIANYRDVKQTLKELGSAGRRWPYKLFSQLLRVILKPFSIVFVRFSGLSWRSSRKVGAARSEAKRGHPGVSSSSDTSSARPSDVSDGTPRPKLGGTAYPKDHRNPAHSRRHPSVSDPLQNPFPPDYPKPFQQSFRGASQERVYWAPGVSSRLEAQDDMDGRRSSGVMTLIKLLSNPAGELLPVYEQLPWGKRGIVGYALAVLANLCFMFGATQYFTSSSWLLASCLWAAGGLMFVAMVLMVSVVRVWMRSQVPWTANIFMMGTAMLPLGLLTIAAGVLLTLTEPLSGPWGNAVTVAMLLGSVLWAFSQAVIALYNGLRHIHRLSGRTAAWLSPLILGLGIAAGVGTWNAFAANLFSVSVTVVSI
ncbi:MAG: DnaJ domain-containing protein [Cyanobacteria bacterium P01_F01_bin.3]